MGSDKIISCNSIPIYVSCEVDIVLSRIDYTIWSNTKSRQEVSVMGTFVVGAIVVLIVGLIVRGIVKDKKSGKSSCGGDCSHCRGCH